MRQLNFLLIKLALCVIIGTIVGLHILISNFWLFSIGGVLLIFFMLSFLRARKLFFQDSILGSSVLLLFIFFGIFSAQFQNPLKQESHYINHVDTSTSKSITDLNIILKISEKLKPGLYNEKYIANVLDVDGEKLKGKVLVDIQNSPDLKAFQVGDILMISEKFTLINPALNPFQFDYSAYMKKLGVSAQIKTTNSKILFLQSDALSIQSRAGRFRDLIIQKLNEKDFKPDELAVIQALLLGQRQEISTNLYEQYAAAGAVHILAVSGLHVGIILLMLNFSLSFLNKFKYGKILKTLLLIILMWMFAIIAGLSPSVIRAVTMFSFVAIGMQMNRKTSVLNSLFGSLLLLLLINPNFIYQVGFQLSYTAVFAIVVLYPVISKLYVPRYWLDKYLWDILTVSIAAQIGVLPLSLYYFHQFPGLFFVTNIVILPFLGFILAGGLIIICLALMGLLTPNLATIYGKIINYLNEFVAYVGTRDSFIFENIHFSILQVIGCYILMILILVTITKFSYKRIIRLGLGILLFQIILFVEKQNLLTPEAIIFHKSRGTIIGNKQKNLLEVHHSFSESLLNENPLKDYKTALNIKKANEYQLENLYALNNNKVLIIDNLGVYQIPKIKPDIILLSHSPRINLQRSIIELQPNIIIADGSNYTSFVENWRATAIKNKIPFHYTGEKGYYLIK